MRSHIVNTGHAELEIAQEAVFNSSGGEFTRVCRPAATAADVDMRINETRQESLAGKVHYTCVCGDDGCGTDCGNFLSLDYYDSIFPRWATITVYNPGACQGQYFIGQ